MHYRKSQNNMQALYQRKTNNAVFYELWILKNCMYWICFIRTFETSSKKWNKEWREWKKRKHYSHAMRARFQFYAFYVRVSRLIRMPMLTFRILYAMATFNLCISIFEALTLYELPEWCKRLWSSIRFINKMQVSFLNRFLNGHWFQEWSTFKN